jgi:hypothetical protein
MLKKLLFFIVLFSFAGAAVAQHEEKEASLKAAFIYNFIRYIEWNANPDEGDFVIAVIGSSPIIESLNEVAKKNTAKNKKIIVRQYSKPEDISSCHILFIPSKVPYSLQSILGKTGKGTLTISEEPDFAKKGTAFNFIISTDNKLKFEANLKAIDAAGLKASSQLLKLATIVE